LNNFRSIRTSHLSQRFITNQIIQNQEVIFTTKLSLNHADDRLCHVLVILGFNDGFISSFNFDIGTFCPYLVTTDAKLLHKNVFYLQFFAFF